MKLPIHLLALIITMFYLYLYEDLERTDKTLKEIKDKYKHKDELLKSNVKVGGIKIFNENKYSIFCIFHKKYYWHKANYETIIESILKF